MKNLITMLIVSVIATASVYSQIRLMPKAGATLSNVAYSDDIKDFWDADFSYKLGFTVGVAAEIPLGGEMIAIQPELLWIQKGYNYKYEETGYSEDYNYTLNYLEIPVMVKVKFGPAYLSAGPSIGFGLIGRYNGSYTLLGRETDDDGKVKFGDEPADYEGDDEYIDNAVDFGVQVGAGVRVSVLEIDFRYGIGLTDLYDKPAGFSGDTKSQNRTFQLTVGYPLGGRGEIE